MRKVHFQEVHQRWRYHRRLLIIKVHAWWLDSINKNYVSNQFSAIRNNDGDWIFGQLSAVQVILNRFSHFGTFCTTLAQKFGLPT